MNLKKIVAKSDEFIVYETTDGYSVLDRNLDEFVRSFSENLPGVSVFRNWLLLDAAKEFCELKVKEQGKILIWQILD